MMMCLHVNPVQMQAFCMAAPTYVQLHGSLGGGPDSWHIHDLHGDVVAVASAQMPLFCHRIVGFYRRELNTYCIRQQAWLLSSAFIASVHGTPPAC